MVLKQRSPNMSDEAKELALQNGIEFVQDKCIYVVHKEVYS